MKLNPENAFRISRWAGNDDDTALYDLAAFLKSKITSKITHYRLRSLVLLLWISYFMMKYQHVLLIDKGMKYFVL